MPFRPSVTVASSGIDPPFGAELLRLNPCTQLNLRFPTGGCHPCTTLTLHNQRGHHINFRISATDAVEIMFCPFQGTLGAHEQQDVAIVLLAEDVDSGMLGVVIHAAPILLMEEDSAIGSGSLEEKTWTLMIYVQQETEDNKDVQQETEDNADEDSSSDSFYSWLAENAGRMVVEL